MPHHNTSNTSRHRAQRGRPWGPSPTPLEIQRAEFRARQRANYQQILTNYRENLREQDRIMAENTLQQQRQEMLERSLAPLRTRLAEVIGEAEELQLQISRLHAVETARRMEDWETAMRGARNALRETERKIEELNEDIERWYGWFHGAST